VTTSQNNDHVQIDFSDTGGGITETDMQKIFDPFFTTKEQGTGLGLSVCYGIVKSHDGDLKYTSQIGKGTIATIELPLPEA
jgi:signal transduction histidine kinase